MQQISLIRYNIGHSYIKFSIFAYLPILILTLKSCQDLLFIVYICIGFPQSSRSQILKELDGLDLSSNPAQSSPIQLLCLLVEKLLEVANLNVYAMRGYARYYLNRHYMEHRLGGYVYLSNSIVVLLQIFRGQRSIYQLRLKGLLALVA